jgi:hypothetical protein
MPKAFNRRICIFCGQRADSKEHIFSKWLQRVYPSARTDFHAQHKITTLNEDGNLIAKNGKLARGGGDISQTSNAVCQTCNNGWMSKIDDSAQPHFTRLFPEDHDNISMKGAEDIARWLFLKSCLLIDMYFGWDEENQTQLEIKRQFLKNFGVSQRIPGDFNFYLARAPQSEVVFSFCLLPHAFLLDPTRVHSGYQVWPKMTVVFLVGNMIAVFSNHALICDELEAEFMEIGRQMPFSKVSPKSNTFHLSKKLVITNQKFQSWITQKVEEICLLETGVQLKLRPYYASMK